jgi:iron(III) transport system substrate-binding protein
MFIARSLPILGLSLGLVLGTSVLADPSVRVISDRTPAHLEPLFEHYGKTRGVNIDAVFVDKGLIARLRARPTEADLVITKTADILEEAKGDGLLQPFASETILAELRPEFRDPDNQYVTLSYRARAIFTSKERVTPGQIRTYDDVTDPKWRGRVCIRSGYHNYNLSLFAQMAADRGVDHTRSFITGLHENLARLPKGNDRAQVRGIYEGQCDVAIANSYYMPIMLSNDDQREWGESARVVFPDQEDGGAFVMRGGAALTTAAGNVEEATRLLEYLVGNEAQGFIVNSTFEYAVNDSVPMPEANRALGKGQPGVEDGKFKANFVPLPEIAKNRAAVVSILDEIDFDAKK